MNWTDFIFICKGTFTTLNYTIVAVFCGFIIAIPIAAMRLAKNKILSNIGRLYISVIRGTPLILQLIFWYFTFPKLSGFNLSTFFSASLAFSINSSAYLAEVLRGALEALDKGQREAAEVLGINKRDTLLDILLPQAMKNISPTIMNEIVTMVKESAIIGVIGVQDLMRRAQLISAAKYDFLTPLIVAAAIYYFLGLGLTLGYSLFAKRYLKRTK